MAAGCLGMELHDAGGPNLVTATACASGATAHRAGPGGGFKHSGLGREMGPWAVDAYTEVKGVWVHTP
jgi:acyl-CoA reductase-like NAD-dependent aldehyde dehydrogenase